MAAEPEDIAGVEGDMTDMESKVALAIAEARFERQWLSESDRAWTGYLPEAKAAIEAHEAALKEQGLVIVPREPTERMSNAGMNTIGHKGIPLSRGAAIHCYDKMIDAALKGD